MADLSPTEAMRSHRKIREMQCATGTVVRGNTHMGRMGMIRLRSTIYFEIGI